MPVDCRACQARRKAEAKTGHICDEAFKTHNAEARQIWGDDAVRHEDCGEHGVTWHHRDYHLPTDVHLSLRLRLRFALAAFKREVRSHA